MPNSEHMNDRPAIFKFRDPVFPSKYFVNVSDNVKAEHVKYPDLLHLDNNCNGLCATDGYGGVYIFLQHDALNHGIIAHEIQHAVVAVMYHIRAPMSRDTEEQMAYINKFITRKTYSFFEREGLEVSCS